MTDDAAVRDLPAAPSLSIVVVSFNSRMQTMRCLESLLDTPPAIAHDIVVVDNASTDRTVEAIRERWPTVQILEGARNLGFGAANNLGVARTSSHLVLFLNSDTIVPPGAIDGLVADLLAHPLAAAAGPRIIDSKGRLELSFGDMVGPASELMRKSLTHLYESGWRFAERRVVRNAAGVRRVDWVSGACLLVWRADLSAVGGFDERYFLYFEDVDLCAALRARGRQILFAPASHVVHERGGSARSAPRKTAGAYRRSQLTFYAKHHPRWLPLLRAYLALTGRLPGTD